MKGSWSNVCGFCSISCGSFVYICWWTVYDVEKAVVSEVPLCYATHQSGKMRFWASLSINFYKQACLPFSLSITFLLWQFSDVFFYFKPENILNMNTKLSLMFPDSTWLFYLYKCSYIYILVAYCIKTYQILHACYVDTFCIRYTYKGVLLNTYEKGWW